MRRPEFIARQSSRPRGLVGRLLGHVMAIETASLTRDALGLLALQPADRLLEVGFGHGRTSGSLRRRFRRGSSQAWMCRRTWCEWRNVAAYTSPARV